VSETTAIVEPGEAAMRARLAELTRELREERAARQAIERTLLEAIDGEQQRLARLVHDTSSQSLNAARLYARVTRAALRDTCPDAEELLVTLEEIIKTAADEAQNLARWLRPARLDGSGLIACMSELAQLATGTVPCEFHCAKTAIHAQTEIEIELLRITQLALHALVQSCRTEAAGLELELELDERYLIVELRASCAQPLPLDLATLLDGRARAMGGSFTVQHEAKRGSTLTCRMPKRR
jgi:signal transduction histidine kinase